MTKRNVCDVLLEILADAGVEHIFGIPGDAINDLVDAVRRQDRIAFIQVRHEEAGAFAAAAQAKLTGRLGVCVGTAGPGAVHLLNGLYDAKMDHAPVLAITGQVPTDRVGTDYHQEVDAYTLYKDVAVFNQCITNPAQMPGLAVRACREALAHGGVAHIGIPADIAAEPVPKPDARAPVVPPHAAVMPSAEALDAAAEVLNRADKVAILAGIGCQGAPEATFAVAEKLAAPVARTLRAKDVIPDDHPLSVGGLGRLGTRPGADAISGCDALLLVGTDFPYGEFFPDGKPAVQIDNEPTRIGKRYPVTVGLAGDAALTLKALDERLTRKSGRGFLKDAQSAMAAWRKQAEKEGTSSDAPIRPQALAHAIAKAAGNDAVFTCDTGTVTVWAARHLAVRGGQRFTLSSSLASMAFAMPGAIGAQLAFPDRQVIALCGDGGFAMLMGDFLTAVKYRLPIKAVIFDNHKLGLIQMEQEARGYPEFQTDLHNPDFAAFAELCGGHGIRVTAPDALPDALAEAFATDGPVVVDVEVNPEELVIPPHIGLGQAVDFGLAKVREFVGEHGKSR